MSGDELSRFYSDGAPPRSSGQSSSGPRYSGLKHHAKVHSFRFLTVILAWLLIAAAFYQEPALLTGLQRAI